MNIDNTGKRLTILVGESDRHGHHSLVSEIVKRVHSAGLAGATVFRGVEGYGATNRLHTTHLLSLSDDLPMAIVIIDTEERMRAFLPTLDDVVGNGVMTLEDVQILSADTSDGAKDAES